MKSALLCIIACLMSGGASASILPPNHFNVFDDHKVRNITEVQFNEICDHIIDLWQPYAQLHGATLVVEKRWDDSTVNASASQSGNIWTVTMYGGLARREEVTPDGFALVVCHELGHHFGGYYFYDDDPWAAAEGEADYFATHVCGNRVFQKAPRNKLYRNDVPKVVEDNCKLAWGDNQANLDICYRQAYGGLSLSRLLAKIGGEKPPQFETPDTSRVGRTNVEHPESQCRLDTYFQGALCSVPFDLKVIPGKDLGAGENNGPKAEDLASQVSCFDYKGHKVGFRPACWFKDQNAGL